MAEKERLQEIITPSAELHWGLCDIPVVQSVETRYKVVREMAKGDSPIAYLSRHGFKVTRVMRREGPGRYPEKAMPDRRSTGIKGRTTERQQLN
jgi:hypothetical protein